MKIEVVQTSSTKKNEFDILYDGILEYKAELPFITIKEPLGLEKIRDIKIYDLNEKLVYSTNYNFIENKKEEFVPFKFLITGSQKFNQLSFNSQTDSIKVYFEENEIWNNRYVIEMNNKKYYCYSVEDGYVRHCPIYDGEKQVGEILKSNIVIDAKDQYYCYLKDEYTKIADGIVALLLYLDRSQYNSSYLYNESFVMTKKYSYNKNNKYYDENWVKNNFGNEFYTKLEKDVKEVKDKIKNPSKVLKNEWASLNKIKKIIILSAIIFGLIAIIEGLLLLVYLANH